MPKYAADVIPACVDCDGRNQTKVCAKCAVVFCKHFASSTDYRYCANCISDFRIKETIIEKIVEHERPDGTISFSRKYQARQIMLQGTDWLFAAHKIEDMDDAEVEATIEYHRANVGLLLDERQSRQHERYKKLAGIKVTATKHETQEEREKREAKEAAKAARKSRSKTKDVTLDKAVEALAQLAKFGMSQQQILELLAGGKK
jgi:alkylhydroperoxidase family enzyme